MKKEIIVGVIIFIITISLGFIFYQKNSCNINNFDKCDKSCVADSDCKIAGCDAININEKYNPCRGFLIKQCVEQLCVSGDIRCVDNNCEYISKITP